MHTIESILFLALVAVAAGLELPESQVSHPPHIRGGNTDVETKVSSLLL
jgi:hypothetical protein